MPLRETRAGAAARCAATRPLLLALLALLCGAAAQVPQTTVSNCLELEAAVAAFTAEALSGGPYVRRSIALACRGDFRCHDPSRPRGAQSIYLNVSGSGSLTISSAAGCRTGGSRPRLYGGEPGSDAVTSASSPLAQPLVYVGTPQRDDPLLRGAGQVALTLDGLILDGRLARGGPPSRRGRGGLYAYYADSVTLRNTDVVNCRSASRYGGGGLYLEDSPLVMTGGRLDNNAASGDGGGALALAAARDSPRLMIFAGGVSLSGNSATGRGGALAVGKAAPGPAAVKCVPACSFVRNTAAGCAVLHSERQDYYNREIDSVAVAGGTSPSVSPPGAATVSAAASTRPAGAVRPTLLAGEPPSIVLGTSSFTGNSAGNGLLLCGSAVAPFKAVREFAAPGPTGARLRSLGPGGEFSDFRVAQA